MAERVERKIDELFKVVFHSDLFLRSYIFSNLKSDFPICGFFFSDLNLWSQELG